LLKPRDARSPRWRRRTATIAQRELPLKGSRRREALATLAALASVTSRTTLALAALPHGGEMVMKA
jgi:hypothetical protein